MQRIICVLLAVSLSSEASVPPSASGKEVLYVGGTIPELSERTVGSLDTENPEALLFKSPSANFSIRYENITSIEYGQKAGRRLGVALTLTVLALLSKKRKHYLTIGFTDENDTPQGVVLEVPKGTAKSFIIILEVRSGRKVEYESEEARKHVHG